MEKGLHPLVCETKGRSSLVADKLRTLEGVKGLLSNRAVMADSLDVE